MAATTTTFLASELLRSAYGPWASPLFYNEFFLPLFPKSGPKGGDAYRFKIAITGNGSATTFSEGDALGASGQVTWIQAVAPWTYFRSIVQISGHAEDAVRDTDQGAEQRDYEFMNATLALRDLQNTTYMADAATGLLGIVDDDTTALYGISRTTYTALQSAVTAVGGALALSNLQDMYEALRDNDRGAKPGELLILSPLNQITNYVNLATQVSTGTTVSLLRKDASRPGGVDYGYLESGLSFCGVPWVGIPDFVDTEIAFICTSPGCWEFVEHRLFRADLMAKTDDSETWQLSCAAALICRKTRQCGKLETVDA